MASSDLFLSKVRAILNDSEMFDKQKAKAIIELARKERLD